MAVSYVEVLVRLGWLSASGLSTLLRAWQSLFACVRPHLILAESSPTAVLAARLSDVPRALMGTGFTLPPAAAPLPTFLPTDARRQARLRELESSVLGAANAALHRHRGAPLTSLAELFRGEPRFLCTLPELDPYRRGPGEKYQGPMFGLDDCLAPAWRSAGVPKIFLYLKPEYALLGPLLEALGALEAETIAYVPGTSAARRAPAEKGGLRIYREPLAAHLLAADCDLAITHGGHGLSACFLLHGVPQLVIPLNVEQLITGRNLRRLAAGAVVHPTRHPDQVAAAAGCLLGNTQVRDSTARFAKNKAGNSAQQTVERIEEALAAHL